MFPPPAVVAPSSSTVKEETRWYEERTGELWFVKYVFGRTNPPWPDN